MTALAFDAKHPLVQDLNGGTRWLWSGRKRRPAYALVLYLTQGCQWGSQNGKRDFRKCRFCHIPSAAQYLLDQHNSGNQLAAGDQANLFRHTLDEALAAAEHEVDTVAVYNAGSFLEPLNPPELRRAVFEHILSIESVQRIVIESRVSTPLDDHKVMLLTDEALSPLMELLAPRNVELEIRFGVETKNKRLRNGILGKGLSDEDLLLASKICKSYSITPGAYVLLNPAPFDDMRDAMEQERASDDEVFAWAEDEALETIRWILRPQPDGIGFSHVFFRAVSVQDGSGLEDAWNHGQFRPANHTMVLNVLKQAAIEFGSRVELLHDAEEPEMIKTPSNHVPTGIHQDLHDAQGCDVAFRTMFEQYRQTMDPNILHAPPCATCNPM